jgi:catechol 2,3-dioxygenase-like lactoylglutathione lyase family enzyme
MLSGHGARSTLPVLDLEPAKRFYGETLGLAPVTENERGVVSEVGGSGANAPQAGWAEKATFRLFVTPNAARGGHTQMAILVDDLVRAVAELRHLGVKFEDYDLPGLKTVDGIAPILGGRGKAAWFKDSEDNLIALEQLA